MKNLLFCFIFLLAGSLATVTAQSITVREIETPKQVELPKVIRYDTLSNIGKVKDYGIFIGQDILFYPRHRDSDVDVYYYGNFTLPEPDTLFHMEPDTIWLRKKKK